MTVEYKVTRGDLRGVEVRGEVFAGAIEGMGAFRELIQRIIKEKNVEAPKVGQWYSFPALLAVFDAVLKKGGPLPLMKIGTTVISTAVWPEDIRTFEQALNSIDIAYHMNHRRDGKELFDYRSGAIIEGGIGHSAVYVDAARRTAEYITDNFYPCDFMKGMVTGAANRIKPPGADTVTLTHNDTKPCRKKGGDICSFILKW